MSDAKNPYQYDWADLAFSSKKPLRDLKAIFIAAPRELSEKRFKQLIKQYLPQGDIVLGVSKEPFVLGFEAQPQFRMLEPKTVQKVIDQVNTSSSGRRIYVLEYFQRELPHILEKLTVSRVVLVNGSWQHVFHNSTAYYYLTSSKTPYDMVSPFADEQEAHAYEEHINQLLKGTLVGQLESSTGGDVSLLQLASTLAKESFDYSFQTGAVLARPDTTSSKSTTYTPLTGASNRVVPYQTYALHHGSAREKHFSPANDLNHYDTVHAEVALLITAQKKKLDLHGTTLFINLMPCPTCARMLSQTDIKEFVYSIDHSDGYAVKMLEAAGKTVRRVVL